MEDFILQLIAQLDTSKAIQDYDTFKKNLDKEINIKVNLDTSNINNISKFAEQLQSALLKVSNEKLNIDTSQIINALQQAENNAQKTGQEVGNAFNKGISKSFSNGKNIVEQFRKSLENAGKSSAEIDSIIGKVENLSQKITSLSFSENNNGFLNINATGLDEFGNKLRITQSLIKDTKKEIWNISKETTSIISTKELEQIEQNLHSFQIN